MFSLKEIGQYVLLQKDVFSRPPKGRIFWKQVISEIDRLGMTSIGIISIVSIFVGAAVTIQLSYNTDSPWLPLYTLGFISRKAIMLEFSPTIVSLILAGKVGSHIASEIGTMRVTEQIDALEVMGINPANYLILPKMMACVLFFPILIVISIALALIGGWLAGIMGGLASTYEFVYGLTFENDPFDIWYAIIKSVTFAYLISTVSAFFGYYTSGGALEVGQSSTKAVIASSIMIIIFNLILTQLLLS